MIAETMQQVGLLPEERYQHPDDKQISDHVQFFSHLSGQLAGVKVLMDNARESSRLEKEIKDLKAELAPAKQRCEDLERRLVSNLRDRNLEMEELRGVAVRATEVMRRLGLEPRSGTRIPPPPRSRTTPSSSTAWRASLPGSRSRWTRPWNRRASK